MNPPRRLFDSTRATPDLLPVLALRESVVFPLTLAAVSVDRERARRIVDDALRADRLAMVVAQREGDEKPPRPEQLYAFGTAGLIHECLAGPDDVLRVAVQGLERVRIVGWGQTEPYLVARVQWLPDVLEPGLELDALVRAARRVFRRFVSLMAELSNDLAATLERVDDPRQLVYLLASTAPMTIEARQQLLEQPSVTIKLKRIIAHLQHDIALREIMQKIGGGAACGRSNSEREALVRKQVEAIRRELDERPADETPVRDARPDWASLNLPEEARREVDREVARLERIPSASPEHGMIRTYLDWVAKMPWGKMTGGAIDVAGAREVLDADHYGLPRIKDRIVEYLAVRRLRAERGFEAADAPAAEPILCLVGPPGVGKTSLGKSIARALGRSFVRMSLGGVHDEAEIRGHRRTYLGAMPGRILQALARCGSADPVFMFDEVDKLGVGFHGDPSAALLEVLDPAQNRAFVDAYLGVAFDLSRVLFVCTANAVDTIPAPLLDRMEVVAIAGYTDAEKLSIARQHLLPRAIAAHGLRPSEVAIGDDAVQRVVRGYTREAGVRNLGRELGGVLRKVACHVSGGVTVPVCVGQDDVRAYLGAASFEDSAAERIDRPGIAMGLAWMPTGGEILFVEATIMPAEEDDLVLTGMMGSVMRESARAALSYLRSNMARYRIDLRAFARKTVHVHVPAGAIPKDGPSAGVTILVALASAASGRSVRFDMAMTGEITLRGRVLPVGGVKEKVLAAHRAGLRRIILPRRCESQFDDVPENVRGDIEATFVDSAEEALSAALIAAPEQAEPAARAVDRSPLSVRFPAPRRAGRPDGGFSF